MMRVYSAMALFGGRPKWVVRVTWVLLEQNELKPWGEIRQRGWESFEAEERAC